MVLWWTYQQLRAGSVQTRLAAIAKLVESGNTDSVEPLVFALKDKDPEVRRAAARALGEFTAAPMLDPLVLMLQDQVPEVRAAAVEALGKLGDASTVSWLTGLMTDTDPVVRKQLNRSLQKLGWRPQTDEDRKWQILATGNLTRVAELGSEGIAPLLEAIRQGEPAQQVTAIKALGEIGDASVIKPLTEALKLNNVPARVAALELLERFADPSCYPSVEFSLADKEPSVRVAAVATAVRCGGQQAVPGLVKLLQDTSWEVRHEAVKALGLLGGAAAVDGLCGVLQDRDRDVRESATNALGKIGDRRAIRALVLALMDAENSVRTVAHLALGRIDHQWEKTDAARSTLPEIQKATGHPEYWISHSAGKLQQRIQAAAADLDLAGFTPSAPETPAPVPPHPAFDILADLLNDHDPMLRLAAAEAFGQLRESGAVALLDAARQDDHPSVRAAAARARAAFN